MESIAAVFGAIARGLRGLFDLASMAVGVAPTSMGLMNAVCMPTGETSRRKRDRSVEPFGDEEMPLSNFTREALEPWPSEVLFPSK